MAVGARATRSGWARCLWVVAATAALACWTDAARSQGIVAPEACITTANPTVLPAGGGLVTLTASCTGGGPPVGYLWQGPGVQPTTVAPTQQVLVTATSTFTAFGANSGGISSTVTPVTVLVDPPPPATCSISPSSSTLPPSGDPPSVTLTAACSGGGPPTSYRWTLPGGTQVSTVTPQLVATAVGAYTVQGLSGQSASPISAPATVAPPSPASCSISPSSSTLPPSGDPVTLTASCSGGAAATSFRWTLPGGAQVTTAAPQLAATTAGSYTVQGFNASAGSPVSAPATVLPAPPASCSISPSSSTLPPGGDPPSVTLTATCSGGGAATSYLWTLPGGAQVSTAVPQLAATAAGAYTVQGFNGPSGSPVSPPATVSLAPPASCSISPASSSLPPGGDPPSVTLTAACSGGGAATSYRWTLPGGAQVSTSAPQLAATAPGSYTVQGINSSGASPASAPATVAGAAPTSCAISPSSVTLPSGGTTPSATLTAACSGGGSPTSYLWTLPGGAQVSTSVPQLVASVAGAYTVQAFSGSASSPVSAPATVFPPAPTACSISPAVVTLPPDGNPVTLTATCTGGTATSYLWTLPGGEQVTTVAAQLLAAKPGRYAVQGKSGDVTSPPSAAAVVASGAQIRQAARQVTAPQATAALTIPTAQLDNIRQHLDQLRFRRIAPVTEALRVSVDGRALPALGALALAPAGKGGVRAAGAEAGTQAAPSGGGAAADSADAFSRWSAFVNGDVNIGRQSGSDEQAGFKLTSRGLTLGGDYRFPGEHVFGAAVGFAKSDSRLDDGLGTQDIKGYSFTVFGSLVPADKAYVDLIVNFARTRFDSQRQQQAGGSASSNTDGSSFAAALSAGWNLSRGALTANPYGRVEYVDASIDGFTETGDAADALTVSEQRIKATTLTLGGQLSYAASTSWGVLLPYAKVELQHLAQTSARDLTAQLAVASSPAILVPTLGEDRTFGNFSVGASAILPRGVSGFFTYEQLFGKDNFRNRKYTLGLRVEF